MKTREGVRRAGAVERAMEIQSLAYLLAVLAPDEREPAEVIRLQARRICQRLEGIADEPPEAA